MIQVQIKSAWPALRHLLTYLITYLGLLMTNTAMDELSGKCRGISRKCTREVFVSVMEIGHLS